MNSRQEVLDYLLEAEGAYLSGQKLAEQLGVSRNAIWKAIQTLKDQGYQISSTPNKGYRLEKLSQDLDPQQIDHFLQEALGPVDITYDVRPSMSSTNDLMKEALAQPHSDYLLYATQQQTKGRGRRGKAYFCDLAEGLYFTLALHPQKIKLQDVPMYTILAATAVVETIESYVDDQCEIKWVNDIFYHKRKVTGILSEMITSIEAADTSAIMIGIGLNLAGSFANSDPAVQEVAGTIFGPKTPDNFNINQFLAQLVSRILSYHAHFDDKAFFPLYKDRLMGVGKEVSYQYNGDWQSGIIVGVNPEGQLIIAKPNGKKEILYGQDIHFSSQQFRNL
ncbi:MULTISPECIES: biotin--[acetyl-CoA-carboxylase] ligase [Aerococcus]|uniref:Bifunctional ligase/repressor BirA n=1 Tax=Aerococcus sanguinicola TaxID=119206 RepID=A0A5N1GLH2_9LACT|nr:MULTISPECIES: biotin--[acetyl-CoA-carboxylase] ligase [Aerococcus]KAA9301833.1 biotin--[acetyl-CoA-carboxylase] ligase [Aerococcus sanguinicola]MDK6368746.1 biotin--[acetyl-CoA-carboxylase] ligase [Aerococcus sp. UMB9870]MDK6679294.1 biotin--[acetyl-CoA-carboxylase] ligase [Aerococcus sp. UMB8608]MDK6685864.1 biotin--[acetyl-CoA-carboxylase] ligase [Aerococcus sp. UMB8623]MDK6939369.1 biotin--[acetyl-CoA-carboxylase] ligase [Aerococcus sp. UMB8487]